MAIVLQIYFQIEPALAADFEALYATHYRPALRKQVGYQESRLLRIFETATATEILAAPTPFDYQLELKFSSERARRDWVKSAEHEAVWPVASVLSSVTEWRGYELVENDFYDSEA